MTTPPSSELTPVPAPGPRPPASRRRGPDWLHPGWSWTVGRAWVITALSASVTLVLGAVLGALPAVLAGSWSDPQTRFQTWVLIGFTVASLAAAGTAIVLYRKRRWVLYRNGTAYVVQELASDWARQDEKVFLESAGRHFARVVKVPGPGQLGYPWDWSLDSDAQFWDGKVWELARAFQALRFADDPGTPNGILMWASWAVAVAFGMRVTGADRDLVLDVWHRPSSGRAGRVDSVIGTERPHRFGYAEPAVLAKLLPRSAPHVVRRRAWLTANQFSADAHRPVGGEVSVLLLRMGHQAWGPLPEIGAKRVRPVELQVDDAAGVCPDQLSQITIYEWRCLPPPGELFPWAAIPSLVVAAANWIERQAADLAGHTVLLGTTMPPEAALGLGIVAGQIQRTRWPENMWPLIYQQGRSSLAVPSGQQDPGSLVVPRLNLGRAALRDRNHVVP